MGIRRPRLALAALNPHAGEEGAFGDEEETLLAPALARARDLGAPAAGPFPADSVFFRAALGEFDAVVALYHDQGLIPVKLLDAVDARSRGQRDARAPHRAHQPGSRRGLRPRGQGQGQPASMIAALRLAARMAAGRARRTRG